MQSVQELVIRVVVDDNADGRGLLGEGGFSALLEAMLADGRRIKVLFDAGPSHVALSNNMKALKIDPTTIDCVVVSHGHWDHVGGLMEAVSSIYTGSRVPVVCHPQTFVPKYFKADDGSTTDISFTDFYSLEDLEEKAQILATTNPYQIIEGVTTTGEVPRRNDFEKLSGRLLRVTTTKDGKKVRDELDDDLSLVCHMTDGKVVILTGCCHAGIVNTTEHASKLTGTKNIIGIVGGFHLFDSSNLRLQRTADSLKNYSLLARPGGIVAPCHCSGLRGKVAMLGAFPETFVEATTGSTIALGAKFEP